MAAASLGIHLDDIEGVTFGPTLANGNRSLVLVSENNFATNQFTQFLAFEVQAVPEPATYAMMVGAGLLFLGIQRTQRVTRFSTDRVFCPCIPGRTAVVMQPTAYPDSPSGSKRWPRHPRRCPAAG